MPVILSNQEAETGESLEPGGGVRVEVAVSLDYAIAQTEQDPIPLPKKNFLSVLY